ncbi:beta-galactosidase [Erythrobacter litoralis]|uniref:Beta-galactosidase n=1 Tax=Erythrobacter litoralis (strain HTCC2594) TaxID=314225 RepID=Q2NBV7_ERYLH|nr:beta-galactosidase [Erythrobacter litoralis]ABC62834.1 beta-galactosidase [Erythrobacter litoralis HTCC2594]
MKLGVCYYPEHWPEERWPTDARMMRETGLKCVRIGEFAWSRIEPEPGRFEWDWLDRAIDVLASEGLEIILGTPTATPPKWLVDAMPDMVALDRQGRPRGFGSRRHYCFSHDGYREEAKRITRAVAERYGQHPAVVSWQTDNEYGCHDTVQSFSPAAREAFRVWLAERYGSIQALNEAWGNVFWSMEYRSFDAIELPNLTVTEANPSHWLAFRRFSSDQVLRFNQAQVDILRGRSPGRDITHNAMGFYTGYDHFALGEQLDVLGWDSYPLGFLEMFRFSDSDKIEYARTGHPDIAAFHHDLYRGCAKDGRWSVLEQQPGPVNWARYNPAPLDGMVHLWTVEAAAHGAEMLCYFRWRQAPFAQEQMHAGLLRPDGEPGPALAEAGQSAEALAALGDIGKPVRQAAIVFAYDAEWITQIQPQGEGLSALWAAFDCYSALRELGLNVDFVPPGASLEGYALVVVPCLPHVPEASIAALRGSGAQVVIGPRSGSKTAELTIPDALAPGALREVIPLRVVRSESLRPGLVHRGDGWELTRWLDHAEVDAEAELVSDDGVAACWRSGRFRYAAGWLTGSLLRQIVGRGAEDSGLEAISLSRGLRKVTTGRGVFWFNYGPGQAEVDGEQLGRACWRFVPT